MLLLFLLELFSWWICRYVVLVSFINHEDMNHLKVRHMFSYKKDVPRPRKHFLQLFFIRLQVGMQRFCYLASSKIHILHTIRHAYSAGLHILNKNEGSFNSKDIRLFKNSKCLVQVFVLGFNNNCCFLSKLTTVLPLHCIYLVNTYFMVCSRQMVSKKVFSSRY